MYSVECSVHMYCVDCLAEWKFRSSKRHCSALESAGMLHSFYAAVQCVLPQSDVQEWCIVYRVVHGAQYAGVCTASPF